MAEFNVHKENLELKYKTSFCSKATLFYGISTVLTFVAPLLIAYRSQGFWMKVSTFREQPDVHFKYQLIYILETAANASRSSAPITWSTFANYNHMMEKYLRTPSLKVWEEDTNKDGKYDCIHANIDMPLKDDESVVSVKLILLFDYQLHQTVRFIMESMALIQYSSGLPGGELQVFGDLVLMQKQPLAHRGIDLRFNTSIFDANSISLQTFNLSRVIKDYSERNVSTYLGHVYPLWLPGRRNRFSLNLEIRHPEEDVSYYAGFWEVLKWGWIQYLSVLIPFMVAFHYVQKFVFCNQLVRTNVALPWEPQFY